MRTSLIGMVAAAAAAASLLTGDVGAQQSRAVPISVLAIDGGAATANGTATLVESARPLMYCVDWSAGTSAGVVTIEEALTAAFSGTWSSIGTVTWVAASSQECFHLPVRYHAAVRPRISTTVVGGTVDVTLKGE